MTSSILERSETDTTIEIEEKFTTSNDKPNSAHIVMVPEGEKDQTPQAYVLRSRIEGFPITALCGFTWVPNKQAAGLPVCGEIYQQPGEHRDGPDGRDHLPEE
jgi:hypothetical protein